MILTDRSIVALAASSIFALAVLGCSSSDAPAQPAPDAEAPPSTPVEAGAAIPQVDASVPDVRDAGSPFGEPIVIPPADLEKWVWVPIEGSRCADNTIAGVGVNFTSQSRELLVYFQGNGVCYDGLTCNLFKNLLVGMGDDPLDHMWWGVKNAGETGIFDRKAEANPFRKSNYVVFPHCTIDGHTADKESEYSGVGVVHQHGYRNVTEALKRIVPTFADASRIVLTGYSAGGIGVTVNYHQMATAFAAVGQPPPFLVNDAGPIMRKPYLEDGAQKKLLEGWGLDKTVGTFCPKCISEGMHNIYEANATLHPGVRSSQLCAYEDSTVTMLYRLLNGDANIFDNDRLKKGLLDHAEWLAGGQVALAPSVHRSFFYKGDDHGTLFGTFYAKPDLLSFLNDQLSGSPTWPSYTP
ncbi:MAG TPA: pectin acetylesterase-family hydrolase [Labilithrix sp.]|nr:pectin acetylesterase-family hydrolase [Labilithrix sp.]